VGFGEFMRHGATEHDLPRPSGRLDVEQDAHIETAPDPLLPLQDAAGIGLAQTKMLTGKGLD
jgi:hypothetical protein